MTALDKTADQYQVALTQVRSINMQVAQQAAGAALILGEKLAVMAQESTEVDDVRKAYDSFSRKAEVPEKQEAAQGANAAAAAFFNIILDRSAKQVAPPDDPDRVTRALHPLTDLPIEDAVLVDAPWSDA